MSYQHDTTGPATPDYRAPASRVADGQPATVAVRPEPAPPDPVPVPVRVVEQPVSPDTLTDWADSFDSVRGQTQRQILGTDPNRTKFQIRNIGPDKMFISRNNNVSANSYPVDVGETVEGAAQTEIWATCANSADQADIRILIEFKVEI